MVGKRLIKATVPYIVLRQINPGSYLIQRLKFMEGTRNMVSPHNSSEIFFAGLTSTLCVNNKVDGSRNRFAGLYVLGGYKYFVKLPGGAPLWEMRT